ncbi:MAG: type II secretion system major pseudopilin GspG [Candidatus Hydrogenedentes bacterium]|nr:type II secretion system major pseudopilin GspG [Candidatus Hydrogenedentota bacterium]
MTRSRTRRNRGFTMLELMVVLIIIALLATAITPYVVGRSDEAKQTKAKADVAMIESLLDQYYLDMGRYPSTEEGLRVLFYEPDEDVDKWKGPYSKKPIPPDPWDNPYYYECPGTHTSQPYEVASFGRDGQEGGVDYDADITSWAELEGEMY